MINQVTKDKIAGLQKTYLSLAKNKPEAIHEIAAAEIPEMVYNSNAIENSTLSLKDTEDILIRDQIKKDMNIREVYEAKNLAKITTMLLENSSEALTVDYILQLHKLLLTDIRNDIAGRFRNGKEWVRVGTHIGANPDFVSGLVSDLVKRYNTEVDTYFLDRIAYFHAEFETIHPFGDGNGRIGRVLVNQQLMALGLPPIIIRHKSKFKEYYPLFGEYQHWAKHDGFTELFADLLLESLSRRVAYLSSRKIIRLTEWAKQQNIRGNFALNKAKRQTIPAFRVNERWMIAADYAEYSA